MNKEYFFRFLASGENHFVIQSKKKHLCEATYVILIVSSRFVPMDLSYPDDSYPGSETDFHFALLLRR